MTRLTLTIVVTAALCGACLLYAHWVRPMTRIVSAPAERVVVSEIESPRPRSDVALTHLRGHDWVQHARMTFEQGAEAFLAFDHIEPIPDHGNRVRLTPCALVWHVPGSESPVPYTIVCDSARLEFANDFYESAMDLGEQSPGRIIAGALEGNVEITGPDGLVVNGRDFAFSEESEGLYSDHPVQFAYGPLPGEHDRIAGSANKIQVSLKPASSPVLGDDMPRIAGINWVQLRSDVRFYIDTLDDEQHPLRIEGSCDGSFIYYLDEQLATLDDNVRIQRPTAVVSGRQQNDVINCDQLRIALSDAGLRRSTTPESLALWRPSASERNVVAHRQTLQAHGETGNDSPGSLQSTLDFLELHSFVAEGRPVRISSDEAGLVALARAVEYRTAERILALTGDTERLVQAQMDDHRLWGLQLQLSHDDQYRLVAAESLGVGGFQQVNLTTNAPAFEATWNEQASLRNDLESELKLLELQGQGRFLQPGRAELTANQIRLWLKPEAFDRLESNGASTRQVRTAGSAPTPFDRALPIVRALARESVVLRTSQANIHSSEVEAFFSETSLQNLQPTRTASATESRTESPFAAAGDGPEWNISAERIVTHIQHDPVLDKTLVGSIEGSGGIRVDRAAAGTASPTPGEIGDAAVQLTGRRFQLLDSGAVNQTLRMYGHPARFECGDITIEGDDIALDRAGNQATIRGPGSLSFPVSQGLMGEPVASGDVINVQWRERMIFDGQTAEFLTGVKVALSDSMILCERITADINRRIDFTAENPDTDDLALSHIKCHDRMSLEVVDWQTPSTGGNPIIFGIRKGDLAEFEANLETGEFSAIGPGEVHDWSRGDTRRVLISPGSVQANQPSAQQQTLPWDYTHLRFSGTLAGNLYDQVGQLHDRVEVTYAPVEHALSTFVRNDLSGRSASARDAVWLKCDRMQIRLEEGAADHDFVQVAAVGHAELEGQLFRAIADEVTYDEQLGMFAMRGLGHKAAIYYQETVDAPYSDFSAQTIEFIPRRNHLTLDGSPGIRGVQSSSGVPNPR